MLCSQCYKQLMDQFIQQYIMGNSLRNPSDVDLHEILHFIEKQILTYCSYVHRNIRV